MVNLVTLSVLLDTVVRMKSCTLIIGSFNHICYIKNHLDPYALILSCQEIHKSVSYLKIEDEICYFVILINLVKNIYIKDLLIVGEVAL